MTEQRVPAASEPDPEAMARQWNDLVEQSQRVVQTFVERQGEDDNYSIVDPVSIGKAFAEATTHMLSDPQKLAEAQLQLWQDSMKLWQSTAQRMMGGEAEPVAAPERGDRRFKDKAWNEEVAFDYVTRRNGFVEPPGFLFNNSQPLVIAPLQAGNLPDFLREHLRSTRTGLPCRL